MLIVAAPLLFARFIRLLVDIRGAWVTAQRGLDAEEIVETLRAGNTPPPYACFLRAFEHDPYFYVDLQEELQRLDLEGVLADLCADAGLAPVALSGEESKAIGAGRVDATAEEWQDAAALLMANAEVLIVLPGWSEGMLWELRYLREHALLDRALFVMPPGDPERDVFAVYRGEDFEVERRWENARAAMSRLGVTLPPYDPCGGLLSVDEAGSSRSLMSFWPAPTERELVGRVRQAVLPLLTRHYTQR